MNIYNLLIYFITGGLFTTLIVVLEESNQRIVSGLATLIPVFTLVAYIFIGESKGGKAVSEHAWFVLLGTIAAWIPYMITIALLAPHIGSRKAILAGMIVFFVLATIYLLVVNHFKLFQ